MPPKPNKKSSSTTRQTRSVTRARNSAAPTSTPSGASVSVTPASTSGASSTASSTPSGGVTCRICLESQSDLEKESLNLLSTVCGHIFCSKCLPKNKGLCPICRKDFHQMASYEKVLPAELWVQVMGYVSHKDLCSVVLTSQYMNTLASTQQLWAGIKPNKEKVKRDGLIEVFTINRFKNIKALDLSYSRATSERKENLLRQLPQTPLEEVNFSGNSMIRVPGEVLAQGVAHLKAVDLSCTELSTSQSITLLDASIDADSLEKVSLSGVDLRRVPAPLLARAVCRLKSVNLRFASLSTQQCVAILEASHSSNTLVEVKLARVDLSRVPASLLARAVCRLQSVNLEDTRLTTDQLTELLQASLSSNTLVEVNLAEGNLKGVPTELLASAVGRLQKINLSWSWNTPRNMTRAQSIAVGQAVLSSTSLRQVDLRSPYSQRNLPAPLLNSLKLLDYVKI